MLIGEVARSTGVSTKTLRFYEAEGLLPAPDRTAGGYRDYAREALGRVEFIRSAQAAGFTLRQIGEVLEIRDGGQTPCGHVEGLVELRLVEVEQRLAELAAVRDQLHLLRERTARLDPADCDGYCHIIEGA